MLCSIAVIGDTIAGVFWDGQDMEWTLCGEEDYKTFIKYGGEKIARSKVVHLSFDDEDALSFYKVTDDLHLLWSSQANPKTVHLHRENSKKLSVNADQLQQIFAGAASPTDDERFYQKALYAAYMKLEHLLNPTLAA